MIYQKKYLKDINPQQGGDGAIAGYTKLINNEFLCLVVTKVF